MQDCFAQFHASQTRRMKKDIISEIKKENSRVRVIFATSALGMGVDAPHVVEIIHITPPSSFEAYKKLVVLVVQEFHHMLHFTTITLILEIIKSI